MPIHHMHISDNYAEYPWNIDPSTETPSQYKDMAVQPLGNRQQFYKEMIDACVEFYGKKGYRCKEYEQDRVEMSLRQPQSMEVGSFYS